jgi:hypothetical protein
VKTAACVMLAPIAMCGLAAADSPRSTPPPAGDTAPKKEEKKIKPAPPPPPSPPDPIVDVAKNANLESTSRHKGLSFTFALGGGLTVGFGVDDAVGRGAGVSIRLARMASERFAFTAEISSVTLLHQAAGTSDNGEILRDQDTNLLLGLQFFATNSLWVRIAGGIGDYRPAKGGNLAGPAGLFGVGFDVVRFRRVAIGVEGMSIGQINREGLLTATAFMLALNVE